MASANGENDRIEVPPEVGLPTWWCEAALRNWKVFPQSMTIHQAAWLLQMPVSTLYKWNANGVLKGVTKRVGKQLRFDRDKLWEFWTNEKAAE